MNKGIGGGGQGSQHEGRLLEQGWRGGEQLGGRGMLSMGS